MAKFLEEHKKKGCVCPCCGKDDGLEGEGIEIVGIFAEQAVTCFNCDAEWVDYYKLDDTAIGREGKVKKGKK